MKKKTKSFTHRKKCQVDSRKQYVKKLRIYPSFLYSYLDKWLKKMSLTGWHVVHCGIFFFWFEKGELKETEYFTYGLSTQEGKYSFSLQYPFLEKTYGLKKSKINLDKTKTYQIVEIDLNKIDVQNDVGYKEMVNDRNRLYNRYFIRNFCILLAIILIQMVLFLFFEK